MQFKEIDELLNNIVEEYLDGIAENTDEEGNVDFGSGIGYDNEKELISDFILYLKEVYIQ